MFDLFRSRDKAVRILLGALLVLVGFSMLTYLVPNYNNGSGSGPDVVVAEVGKETITLQELTRLIQNTMRGRQLPPSILPTYIPQMVEGMITERALEYEAHRLGIEVTDQQVSDAIRQSVPSLFPDGKFLGREAYASMLGQQNLTIPEFETDMKRQILITRLRNVALEGTVVTPLEIEAEYRKKNEKVKIEYVKLTADKYKAESQPSPDDMQAYYKSHAQQYVQPERKSLVLLVADQSKMEQSVNVTDADLQKAYNQNIAQYRTPETVKVQHILLMTQGKPATEDAKIKSQAEDLLKQVRAGANFKDLVTKFSEDPGKATNNGEYSVQRNGQMVKEFEDAAFTLKPGESQIIKTTYGYHVVQVESHDQPRVKPFEEVKGELATQWKKQRVNDLMQQISDRAQTLLQKDPSNPDKVAASLNMQVIRADYESGKPIADIGPNPDFDQSISPLKKGEVSQPVAVSATKVALAEVTDVIPARPSTFEEVSGQIRDAMVTNRAAAAVTRHATELMEKAKSMGDLGKAAKSMGLEVKTSDEFSRTGAVEGLGSATYVSEAFSRPDGAVIGPIPTPDSTVVAKVISHSQPDMSKLPDERLKIRDDIKNQKARDRNALFESGLRDALAKDGKIKVHQDVIDRLITQYKTS